MKVVLLAPSNVAGGAERVLTSLANQFATKEIETWFIQFDVDSQFYSLDKSVHKIALGINAGNRKGLKKWVLFPKYFFSLRKSLKEIKPDIVISFLFLTNIVGMISCKSLSIPIILSERNDPSEYSKKIKIVMKFVYPWANGFVCQSVVVKEYLKRYYGIKNAVVIANPLNDVQVGESKKEKKDIVLAMGRFVAQKNFGFLIDAFADVAKEFPSYSLMIFGEGVLRKELEEQVKKYNLEERIKLPGTMKNAIKLNNDAKVFVLSSKFEGYPNVLAEAMANGIICIAADVASGTVRELITHGENGFIYPVDDKRKLVELLKTVMSSQVDVCRISEKATMLYEKINIEKIADEWIKYIDACKSDGENR